MTPGRRPPGDKEDGGGMMKYRNCWGPKKKQRRTGKSMVGKKMKRETRDVRRRQREQWHKQRHRHLVKYMKN